MGDVGRRQVRAIEAFFMMIWSVFEVLIWYIGLRLGAKRRKKPAIHIVRKERTKP